MHGRDGDIQIHAIRNQDGEDSDRVGRQIRAGLSAACFTEGIFESPVLRLDGVELSDDTRSSEVAGVAVFGLDILARQRRRTVWKGGQDLIAGTARRVLCTIES